jgi:hypothetical protein
MKLAFVCQNGLIMRYFTTNDIMIMLMWWAYVCEPRPQTGLLFIAQVIYEYGAPVE